jgi:carbamate kinase
VGVEGVMTKDELAAEFRQIIDDELLIFLEDECKGLLNFHAPYAAQKLAHVAIQRLRTPPRPG